MRALIVKEFRELARDHRTLAMLVVLPVLLLVIYGYATNFSVDRVSVIVVGANAEEFVDDLDSYVVANESLEIVRVDPSLAQDNAENLLRDQEADAIIVAGQDTGTNSLLSDRMSIYVDGNGLFAAQAAQGVFVQLAAEDAQDRVVSAKELIVRALAEAEQAQADLTTFSDELASFQVEM